MLTILLFGAYFVLLLAIDVLLLYQAARILKAGAATIPRTLGAVVAAIPALVLALSIERTVLRSSATPADRALVVAVQATLWLMVFGASVLAAKWLLRLSVWRALAARIIAGLPNLLIVPFLMRAFVGEAFVISGNSMAPTLVGWHRTTTCSACGGPLIVTADALHVMPRPGAPPREPVGICGECRQYDATPNASSAVFPPDQILALKRFAEARRWDLIVFRVPDNPSTTHVDRLVGLPGEQVTIQDGSVWINGVEQTRPQGFPTLRFSGMTPTGEPAEQQLWQLQPDEILVLGDFPELANDSRLMGPVPRKNIVGVVTVCYWPPARWRVFR